MPARMWISKHERNKLSPLGRWLLEYSDETGMSLTTLAQRAGLSDGALRYLVRDASRAPTIETCLRLAAVTPLSVQDFLEMAGINVAAEDVDGIDPMRIDLNRLYEQIPKPLRVVLLEIARRFAQLGDEYDITPNNPD